MLKRRIVTLAVVLSAGSFLPFIGGLAFAQTARAVNVLSISEPSGSSRTLNFPVDSTMTRVIIDASFPVAGSFTLTVRRPDDSVVLATDPGVKLFTTTTSANISISSPSQGNWTVVLSGAGAYSLIVTGMSTLDMLVCEFVKESGRPGHEGLFVLPGDPVAARSNTVHASMTSGASTAQFDLRNPSGGILQTLSLSRGTGPGSNDFFGQVVPPSSPFMCYVTGLDISGQLYQRLLPRTVAGQTVMVEPPPPQDLVPGQAATFRFKVTNLGASNTFTITGSDTKGYFQSATPSVVTLGQNESITVDVVLAIPAGTLTGSSDIIRVSAVGGGGTKNSATVRGFVFAKAMVSVPSVVGLAQTAAISTLNGQGLLPGSISELVASAAAGTVLSQNPPEGMIVPVETLIALTVSAGPPSILGDLDNDGDVDKNDINVILAAKGTAASGPNDPRDIDKDGQITILDARKLATMCTRPNCATN